MIGIGSVTCLWPLLFGLSLTFAFSVGLTYRSYKYCYAGTCGEWLFPMQARAHVVTWYGWVTISVIFLTLRATYPKLRTFLATPFKLRVPMLDRQLRLSGLLLAAWLAVLYGILLGVWWSRLHTYFGNRGGSLPGNNIVAAVALTGHVADVTLGMVLLPLSRHGALTTCLKLSPGTIYTFHMIMAYVLIFLVTVHGILYAAWISSYNQYYEAFRSVFPMLNPTYLYHEVWPGNTSALGLWRASLAFTGLASTLIMYAMFATSFPSSRRKHFNIFYFTHLLGIVAVVIICLHASTMFYCTLPGLTMWLVDWAMRLYELWRKVDGRLVALGNGWYRLDVKLPRRRVVGCSKASPLAHFFIHHSKSSRRELHPFTTITHLASREASTPRDAREVEASFLFRVSTHGAAASIGRPHKQWTNRLASLVDEEMASRDSSSATIVQPDPDPATETVLEIASEPNAQVPLRLEGPYFTAVHPENYGTVVCLVAGTGVSGALAIANAFKAAKMQEMEDEKALHEEPPTSSASSATSCSTKVEKARKWQRCIIVWVVRETDFVSMPFMDESNCDGLDFRIYKTGPGKPRPDVNKIVREYSHGATSDTWCYISGPEGFMSSAEQACDRVPGLTKFAAWG